MRRLALLISIVFIAAPVSAQSGTQSLPDPGHAPGSLMYNVDQLQESVSLLMTFSKEKKLEKRARFAEERLAESVKLMDENRTGKASELAQKYVTEIGDVRKEAEENGMSDLAGKISDRNRQNKDVLEDLSSNLPRQAQKGLQTALSKSPVMKGKDEEAGTGEPSGEPRGYVATGRVIQSE